MTTTEARPEARPPHSSYRTTTPTIGARVIERHDNDGLAVMMSEIGDGVFVGWDTCHSCGARVQLCHCTGGPIEPSYIKKWREQRATSSVSNTHQNVSDGLDHAKAAIERILDTDDVGF